MGTKTVGRKGKGSSGERTNNEINALKKINLCEDPSLASVGDGFNPTNKHKEKTTKAREASGNDVEVSASQDEAVILESNADLNDNYMPKTEKKKKEKKKKKRKSEQSNNVEESQKARKKDRVGDDAGKVSEVKVVLTETHMGVGENLNPQKNDKMDLVRSFELAAGKDRKKNHKERKGKDASDVVSSVVNVLEDNRREKMIEVPNGPEKEDINKMMYEEGGHQKKKKKERRHGDVGNIGVMKSATDVKEVGNGRENLDENIMEEVEFPRKERKKKKQSRNANLEEDATDIVSSVVNVLEDNRKGKMVEVQNGLEKEDINKMVNKEEGNQKKKKKKQKHEDFGGIEVIKSVTDVNEVGNGRENLDENNMEKGEHLRRERKKKKKSHIANLEDASPETMVEALGIESNVIKGDGGNTISTKNGAGDGKVEVNAGKKDNKEMKKWKRDRDRVPMKSGSDGKEFGNERQFLDKNVMEKIYCSKEERRKKKKHNVDFEAVSQEAMHEKLDNESTLIGENEGNVSLCNSKAGGTKIKNHTINSEGGNKVKKKKAKSVKNGSEGEGSKTMPRTKRDVGTTSSSEKSTPKGTSKRVSSSEKSTPKGTSKRVSFSKDVEVFPISDSFSDDEAVLEEGLVQGKRFSHEEDIMVKEAVFNYIDAHGLGEEGVKMVMNCRKYPEIKNCWKEIAAAMPWRPQQSVYYRAHILFERDENRSWTQEEYELVRKFHEKHGSDWKTLADALGKHRFHVKDTWRRIKLPNRKKGHWSQEEYQTLFDLVNVDLRLKAFEERKSKHGMLRDNIAWTAISSKLETRSDAICCQKWYDQITSPMVAEGKWLDTDDYHLLIELYELDACCMEDVDWDNLLEHRSGDVCRKRWNQMVKHLGEHGNKSFAEEVDVLINRYCPDVLEAREAYNSKPAVS